MDIFNFVFLNCSAYYKTSSGVSRLGFHTEKSDNFFIILYIYIVWGEEMFYLTTRVTFLYTAEIFDMEK